MWSLLPTPLRKRILIWAPLVVLVVLWHLLLLWLVIGYRGSLYQHHLIIDTFYFNKDIRTVVVPLVKNIAPVTKKTGTRSVQLSAESPAKTSKEVPAQKEIKIKSEKKPSSDAVVASPVVSQKTQKTKSKKQEKESSSAKVPATKEKPIKKEVAPLKSAPVEEKKPAERTMDLSPTFTAEQPSDAGVVVYIGREDAQAQQLYDAVYEAVRLVWTPPPGFGAEVKTEVEIILNWDGSLQKYTVLQSSGVPLFDACVRRDSKKIIFPRGAWGKTWVLTFSNDTKVSYE